MKNCRQRWIRSAVLLLAVAGGAACAGNPATETGDAGARLAPLLSGMGEHSHPISTSEPMAQRYFDQGLVLHYAFNHAEALRSFREAARLDPDCAMCFWGQALTLGPNVNAAMDDANVGPARQALQQARRLAPNTTAAEQALITALDARYAERPAADRSALDLAYADAMAAVVDAYPDDSDAATLWAEAQMISSPWDYWTEDGEPKEGFADVLGILKRALEIDPANPGANHFYIHAVEAVRPELGIEAARRLETLVPGAGHLVHMPAHIYLRLGQYHEATLVNERAMAADEAYERESNQQGLYPLMYMPHNPHFLCYTASMEGRGDYALRVARRMAMRIAEQGAGSELGTLQHYWSTPMYVMARFGRWQEILEMDQPAETYLYPRGVWHFVRGLALLRSGDAEGAAEQLEEVRRIADEPALAEATVWDLNTADALMRIAYRVLGAEIAAAAGDYGVANESLRQAVDIEATLTYDEPPPWYQPVRQVLGAVLLEAGRPAEAGAIYLEDLERFPENGWSLFGLMQSLEAQGRDDEAAVVRQRFEAAWSRADVELVSSRF